MAAMFLVAIALVVVVQAPALAEPRSRRLDPAALAAAHRFLCPHGGAPVRGLRGRCRGTAGEMNLSGGWDGGLAPPARRQAPCPEGTVAIAAIARQDAVRCLPR